MRRPQPALRLRLPRIEKKPKPVYEERWSDYARVKHRPDLQAELIGIIRSIARGDGVPEEHYRAGIDRDRDGLLEDLGIMHLHLGGKDSDVLVFLIQYTDQVVLLEANSHVHFRTQPAGKNIAALSQAWLAGLESDMAEAAAQAQAAATDTERKAAEALRDRRSALIDTFKAKAALK